MTILVVAGAFLRPTSAHLSDRRFLSGYRASPFVGPQWGLFHPTIPSLRASSARRKPHPPTYSTSSPITILAQDQQDTIQNP
jgi:hypothetical protein